MRRCVASAASATDSVRFAPRAMYDETSTFATIAKAVTAIPSPSVRTMPWPTSRRIASNAIAAEPISTRIPSIAAAKFSIFSCP